MSRGLSRTTVFLLIVALALVLSIGWFLSRRSSGGSIVIGCVVPLSGDAASFGENTVKGATLAVKDHNAAGGIQFRVVAEDSRGEADGAVSAATKLLDFDKATVLIGDVTSAGTHALIPLVTERQVPIISPSASDPALSGSSDYFARVWPSDVFEAKVIAERALSLGLSRLAVFYANTDYGKAMYEEFAEYFPSERTVLKTSMERENADYRPSLERLRSEQADGLFLIFYPEDAVRLLRQMRSETRERLAILATATFEDPSLLDVPNAEGVVFASPRPQEDSEARSTFTQRYQAEYAEEPGVLADTGFDAANLLIAGILSQGPDEGSAIMRYIRSLAAYDGASGQLAFDSSGDVEKPFGLKAVQGGAFAWVSE